MTLDSFKWVLLESKADYILAIYPARAQRQEVKGREGLYVLFVANADVYTPYPPIGSKSLASYKRALRLLVS